ncbi:hypothetical protein B0G80_1468 [Paraburkholderia sp. BL6669N2]|uniref:hypothetical protein n=1 Tax=Paraburkholderia sp. BL6669N2 TaxID=1938807 RepID=UPI000E36712D|nr:hypothetical protein [Paraburkholderia sp. BL6669N2]REG58763.1 hypothetical protein B0G80_1468 [Paraburkholderia sp. BL6669N2]
MHASLIIARSEHHSMIETFAGSIPPHERENFSDNLDQNYLNGVKTGLLFIVTTADRIVATSSLCPLGSTLVKAGTCFVAPEYRYFELQQLMHEARAMVIRQRWGSNCAAVSAVRRTTGASAEDLLKLGFSPWKDPHSLHSQLHCSSLRFAN